MNWLSPGFWDIADRGLQWIGRTATRPFVKKGSSKDEGALYAATGCALIWAAFGGVVGFTLADPSRDIGAIDRAILGAALGVCVGIFFGSLVEAVDSTIKDLISSLSSKRQSNPDKCQS
jgi:hypothetical protein